MDHPIKETRHSNHETASSRFRVYDRYRYVDNYLHSIPSDIPITNNSGRMDMVHLG